MAWPVLVVDIESIPDVAGLRALCGENADASDADVYAGYLAERHAKGQSDFMPLHLRPILVISCVFRNAEGIRIHSFVWPSSAVSPASWAWMARPSTRPTWQATPMRSDAVARPRDEHVLALLPLPEDARRSARSGVRAGIALARQTLGNLTPDGAHWAEYLKA